MLNMGKKHPNNLLLIATRARRLLVILTLYLMPYYYYFFAQMFCPASHHTALEKLEVKDIFNSSHLLREILWEHKNLRL